MPVVKRAAMHAQVSRTQAYKTKSKSKAFAAEWQSAIDDGVDNLEQVAYVRAVKSSDLLIMFLLKAHRPEKFRENLAPVVLQLAERAKKGTRTVRVVRGQEAQK